ncbi:peptide chain release factor 2 [Streptomonospora nanhaiensis]|uniref:Peptide chain release factor 2 n=1 Tax=Streptomonospora nanhaiensis TaxID=1323731 RepID=A0A853BNF8_9ACTN|nr:peptide chain release factor 2 [Streptomonospora nanhaiensis]MBV2362120.1 peptide chain release factor 2 [Streptomonospora nanhaiensis]MBV2364808.1 peptide chain release factor 2 [Streptomonospora nanhaiensis]MBX9388573.1 peptide chain release factor 2 [Streptomonospora nanhaiensis]NYI96051.1 peptide chain release factor 2 [Streptomonospora nanhaiensis]
MADLDPAEKIKELSSTLASVEAVLDLDAKQREIEELREQSADPELWNDPGEAQKVTRRLANLESTVSKVGNIRRRLDDLSVLYELAASEDDADTLAEADSELDSLRGDIGELEVRTLLNGPYDEREALVTINSQAGGVDAADWAQMLQRMYLRWAERHGYPTEVYETSYAEEAGIKSTSFVVKAPFAYGTLRGEHGTHRLVRISPFDNQNRRQTSFAGVDVVPVVEQSDHIDIDESELRIDVYRSSGPGGQGVNTTDSAVRITHLPTGIVTSCQNERSQIQNRATAMSMLQAKLLERKRREERAELDELRGESVSSWGTQMRNYVLHPYQSVKDVRTGVESGNPGAILDGEIDTFIDAEIRWMRSQEAAEK